VYTDRSPSDDRRHRLWRCAVRTCGDAPSISTLFDWLRAAGIPCATESVAPNGRSGSCTVPQHLPCRATGCPVASNTYGVRYEPRAASSHPSPSSGSNIASYSSQPGQIYVCGANSRMAVFPKQLAALEKVSGGRRSDESRYGRDCLSDA